LFHRVTFRQDHPLLVMSTSWRPSLKAAASCRTPGKRCEQRSEKEAQLAPKPPGRPPVEATELARASKKAVGASRCQSSMDGSWISDQGDAAEEQVSLIKGDKLTWYDGDVSQLHAKHSHNFEMVFEGDKYTAQLQDDGKIHWSHGDIWTRHKAQPPQCLTKAYGREELLLLRQRIIEARGFGDSAVGSGSLRCIKRQTRGTSPSCELLKELSSDSICSTTDTLSDTSDEHDASFNSLDLTSIGAPPGLEHFLHSSSSEFAASDALRASAPEFIPQATLRASALEFVPRAFSDILCAVDGQLEQPTGDIATDILGLASQRSLEWRDYCRLEAEPDVCATQPQFWGAHWQTALV